MTVKYFSRLVMISIALLFTIESKAQTNEGINFFQGTFKQAAEKAITENKLIFFDAYADWCVPCRYMDSVIYKKKIVGDFFNKSFVSIRVDMEKGEGPELSKIMPSINGYPSLLFMHSNGIMIKTLIGSRSENVLIGEAKLALEN
jgi:thioredoxin 1